MKHRPLVFVDIETTGGSARESRITEIGALRVEKGRIVRKFSQLLDPRQPIPAFITKLTGISDAMVTGQPTFADIADELDELFEDAIFVAHFVQFDYGFIKQEFGRAGREFNMDRLCSVRLDRRLYPGQPSHGLDKVIERMGLTVANRHRAYDDAEVIWKMFRQEYEKDSLELFRTMQKVLVLTK